MCRRHCAMGGILEHMLAVIATGGSQDDRQLMIKRMYPADSYIYTHITAEKSSILIAQIHEMIKNLTVTAQITRLIWIEEADALTIPAQNALLKVLEEPPEKTQIVLSLDNPQSLLATVRSRCRVVTAAVSAAAVNLQDLEVLKNAMSMPDGDRILAADALGRKREELVTWTLSCLTAVGSKMSEARDTRPSVILSAIAALLHEAYTDLKSNVNPSLVIQNLFLSLPHTKK